MPLRLVFVDQRTVNDLADELAQALRQLDVPADVDPAGVRADGLGELHVEIDGRSINVAVITRGRVVASGPFVLLRSVVDAAHPTMSARTEVVELDDGPVPPDEL